MSDALVSPAVAVVATAAAVALAVVALKKVKQQNNERNMLPMMGVMGAFIFAAQMLNFAIPATGSSGHIVGGVLLAAVLGPWAAYLTLASVLVLQALVFADGGLMALGCNLFNMAALVCLVAYPLIYRPLTRGKMGFGRIMWVSILTCVVGLELGAAAVTFETELSGITALPLGRFLGFMLPIHLLIGIVEGVATGAVIWFVWRSKPELLAAERAAKPKAELRLGRALALFAVAALFTGGVLSLAASSSPDGLEWSIERTAGTSEPETPTTPEHLRAAELQESTALMPDYDRTSLSGILGSSAIVLFALGLSTVGRGRRKRRP